MVFTSRNSLTTIFLICINLVIFSSLPIIILSLPERERWMAGSPPPHQSPLLVFSFWVPQWVEIFLKGFSVFTYHSPKSQTRYKNKFTPIFLFKCLLANISFYTESRSKLYLRGYLIFKSTFRDLKQYFLTGYLLSSGNFCLHFAKNRGFSVKSHLRNLRPTI